MSKQSHGAEISSRGSLNRSANRKIARSEFRMVKGVWGHEVGTPTRARTTLVHPGRSTDLVAPTGAVQYWFLGTRHGRTKPTGCLSLAFEIPALSNRASNQTNPRRPAGWFRIMFSADGRVQPNEPNETLKNSSQLDINKRFITNPVPFYPFPRYN